MTSRALMIALTTLLPATLAAPALRAETVVIDFEDIDLPSAGFDNDAGSAGGFTSNGAFFENEFTDFGSFSAWSGWSISELGTDGLPPSPPTSATGQFAFQYHSAAGGGRGGDGNFGVGFVNTQVDPTPDPSFSSFVDLPEFDRAVTSLSAWFANSTYTLLSIELGNEFANPFEAGDFLSLTIAGFEEIGGDGSQVGEVDFDLARGGSVVTDWTEVDLSSLIGSRSLGFRLASSQTSEFGGNTFLDVPAYFVMDDLTIGLVIPEPSSLVMVGVGLAGALGIGLRRGRSGSPRRSS